MHTPGDCAGKSRFTAGSVTRQTPAIGWDKPESWFRDVAESFAKFGCKWGGDWKMKDLPHFQWGPCKASPSDDARALFAQGGAPAVWKAVGAE